MTGKPVRLANKIKQSRISGSHRWQGRSRRRSSTLRCRSRGSCTKTRATSPTSSRPRRLRRAPSNSRSSIGRAVIRAHDAGIVHRDLKPDAASPEPCVERGTPASGVMQNRWQAGAASSAMRVPECGVSVIQRRDSKRRITCSPETMRQGALMRSSAPTVIHFKALFATY